MSPARRLAAGMAAIFWAGLVCLSATSAAADTAIEPVKITDGNGDLLDLLQSRYLALTEKGCTAVVRVNAVVRDNASDATPTPYVWSGFFIDRNADIITNNADNLQKAMRVWVDYNGIIYPADVVGCDPVTNVGLLHLNTPPKDFGALDLSEIPDLPPKGTMLLAITSKLGQPPGPSPGMVQGTNVNVGEIPLPAVHLRVNIPDDGGEGGSPVLDLHGHLVGMMIASLRDSRESLVLPSRAVLRIRDELLANDHHVRYGLFGFDVKPAEVSAGSAPRLIIKSVDYGGPGLAAGLKAGDVLLSVGGVPLQSNDDLRQAWFFSHPGQDLAVVVERDNVEVQLTLHVGEMTVAQMPSSPIDLEHPVEPIKSNDAGTGALPANLGAVPDSTQPAPPVEKKSN